VVLAVVLAVELVVELVVVVPVEALARAVLREQAAALRVLLPIRRPILEARPGAAPILRRWVVRTPVRTPTSMTRTARMKEIKIAHPVAAETEYRRMLLRLLIESETGSRSLSDSYLEIGAVCLSRRPSRTHKGRPGA
jgi:hypothetical protein